VKDRVVRKSSSLLGEGEGTEEKRRVELGRKRGEVLTFFGKKRSVIYTKVSEVRV